MGGGPPQAGFFFDFVLCEAEFVNAGLISGTICVQCWLAQIHSARLQSPKFSACGSQRTHSWFHILPATTPSGNVFFVGPQTKFYFWRFASQDNSRLFGWVRHKDTFPDVLGTQLTLSFSFTLSLAPPPCPFCRSWTCSEGGGATSARPRVSPPRGASDGQGGVHS